MNQLSEQCTVDVDRHRAEVLAWRQARTARLVHPESWLSLIGKHWLAVGRSRVGSEPSSDLVLPADRVPANLGTFEVEGQSVRFEPATGVGLTLLAAESGTPSELAGPTFLRTDALGPPDRIAYGSITLEVIQRGPDLAVRARDRESPARRDFQGIEYFPIDPSWRIVAELEPYVPEKRVELGYEAGSGDVQACPFAAVFERGGAIHRLDPVFDDSRRRLFLLFWDLTCRDQSYGAGRFLYAPLPQGPRLVLDFNQAFNPPCAFTPFATCPLPPPQNRLALRVEAGEQKPR